MLTAAELITVAARMPDAIQETLGFVERLNQAIGHLEGQACTGVLYWRDKDTPGRMPKLYIIHGVDQSCPIHGAPKPGRRVRIYIGSDPQKQSAAFAALERETRRQRLADERTRLNDALRNGCGTLRRLLADLGYDPENGRNMRSERAYSVEELLRR